MISTGKGTYVIVDKIFIQDETSLYITKQDWFANLKNCKRSSGKYHLSSSATNAVINWLKVFRVGPRLGQRSPLKKGTQLQTFYI